MAAQNRLSACDAVFLELVHSYFVIFCIKLVVDKGSKLTVPDFLGRFVFGPSWAKKAQKCTFCL
jgi:hypothetical protein